MRLISTITNLWAALGVMGVLAAGAPALADQSACRNLEASLASVSHGGDRSKVRRYERAIISQQQQLERAKNRQSNAGCSTFLSSLKAGCGEIRATVTKMEANLAALQRTKDQLAGGNAAAERACILAALDDNGCRGGQARIRQEDDRPSGLFARLFGSGEKAAPEPEAPAEPGNHIQVRRVPAPAQASSPGRAAAPGNYRTLCVRTCDGYFFPIAYSSTPDMFDRDTKACEAMCPGTEVGLYYHRVPGEEADAMVSAATGEAYTALPAAFHYREPGYERAKSCQCNPPKDFSIIAGNLPEQTEADAPELEQAVALPAPERRPDPAEDPETRANREGGLTASAMAELLAPKITAREERQEPIEPRELGGRRVRVVGPTFLPDPEEALDLRAPARTELR